MPDPRLEPNQILQGDCREILKTIPSASIDSIVTDPPAGIEFMGKDWDNPDKFDTNFTGHGYSDGQDRIAAPTQRLSNRNPMCRKCRKHMRGAGGCECLEPESDEPPEVIRDLRFRQRDGFVRFMEQVMTECYRVLKPGGHMFVWALPRTSHWTATAIENAGFEIRDCVYHVFGQGFPKSLNVSKAIDKMKGATREVVGTYRVGGNALTPTSEKGGTYGVAVPNSPAGDLPITKPATPEAEQWDGWGTALKPAVECWWLCRKPIEGTNVARNVLQHGTGAINIDGTRVAGVAQVPGSVRAVRRFDDREDEPELAPAPLPNAAGRWPSNLMLSHSEGCRQVGTREVAAPTINRFDDGMKPFGEGAGHPYTQTGGGTEQVSVYECVDGCPVRAMNEQSGETGGGSPRLNSETHRTAISTTAHNPREPNQTDSVANYGDAGGAARYFQTFDKGRWPSNIVLSHTSECEHIGPSENGEDWECVAGCPIAEMDRQGETMGIHRAGSPQPAQEKWDMAETTPSFGGGFSGPSGMRYGDEGGASRFFQNLEPGVPFFYTAKAARSEKEDGLNPFESTKARQNTHPCLHPDGLVMTEKGYRPINEMQVGQLVLSADGRFHAIEAVTRHPYTSPDLFEIRVLGTNFTALVTDNHPYLIWRPKRNGNAIVGNEVVWVRADQIQKGDYTMTPIVQGGLDDTSPPRAEDTEFWFLVGLYLAEGCQQQSHGEGKYASFSLHEEETDLIERIRMYCAPVRTSVYPKADSRGVQVITYDPDFGALCKRLCGSGASSKTIDPCVWGLPIESIRSFVEGYLAGDGGPVRTYFQAKSASRDIASQMRFLAEMVGYKVEFQMYPPEPGSIEGRDFKTTSPTHVLRLTTHNRTPGERKPSKPTYYEHEGVPFTLSYVKEIRKVPYVGDVVNLTVEGNHTFQTTVGMSHNTVKPISLMRYLVKMVTPPGGIVLDPFTGSGSTLIAAAEEGMKFIGIEREDEYVKIARSRVGVAAERAETRRGERDIFELMMVLGDE